ncbi:MAG TPA: hypothetical protein VFA47_02440, partial [Candidatus Manganitrophaceae bacterium]|nr:hypothetical protein [Candidatus Manganitrophaceae bacterium]
SKADLSSGKRNFSSASQSPIGWAKAFPGEKPRPGVFLSDQDGRILYVNEAAQWFLNALGEKHVLCGFLKNARLREILFDLLSESKQRTDPAEKGLNALSQTVIGRNFRHKEIFYQIRSILLKPRGRSGHDLFLFILIEKVPALTS